jgi:hypothetical protein
MEVSGQIHASVALILGEKPQNTLHKRLGGFLSRPRWLKKKKEEREEEKFHVLFGLRS